MISTETTESRGIFSLRDNASCVYFFFPFFCQKGRAVSTVKKVQCDTEESHDRQACMMAKRNISIPEPNHTGGREPVGGWTKLT